MVPTNGAEEPPRPEGSAFELWAVGGGKGGTGKTALTAAIGFQMSRLGRRVVVVDGDFGGANLHTCLGVPAPARSLLDLIRSSAGIAEEYLAPTPYPGLRFIGGRVDEAAASLPRGWGARLSTALRALPVDLVIVDLGAGVSLETVEVMNLADLKIIVSVPEPSSVENVASLLRALAIQRVIQRIPSNEVRLRLSDVANGVSGTRVRSVADLLREIGEVEPGLVSSARAMIEEMSLALVTNQVRDEVDRQFGPQMAAIVRRHFGAAVIYAGFVHSDDAVWRTLRRGKMFMVDASRSRAAEDVRRVTRNLLRRTDLSPVF